MQSSSFLQHPSTSQRYKAAAPQHVLWHKIMCGQLLLAACLTQYANNIKLFEKLQIPSVMEVNANYTNGSDLWILWAALIYPRMSCVETLPWWCNTGCFFMMTERRRTWGGVSWRGQGAAGRALGLTVGLKDLRVESKQVEEDQCDQVIMTTCSNQ